MQPNSFEKMLVSLVALLAAVASTVLAIMMFLMAADVIGRYIFNAPIPGALELIEFAMAIIVPLAILHCAAQRSHVVVDLVVDRFPRIWRLIVDTLTSILCAVFAGIVCWRNILNVIDTYSSKMTSAVLKLPSFPFGIPLAAGMGLFALILLAHLMTTRGGDSHGAQ